MSNFQEFIEEQFFILDSNNLENIKSKLYGFTIQNGMIFDNNDLNHESDESYMGTYVHIKKNKHKIIITQDMNGSYGLYIYKCSDSKNYFVISNSFLKLVTYLKEKTSLNFNYDYASSFLTTNMCSFSYKETMIKEIKRIPRNWTIIIDLKSKIIEYGKIDFQENSISLDSEEGINLLDSWFNRWIKIIRNIYIQRKPLITDLSGGFDSRLLLTLFLCANIDLNNINIHSNINEFQKEDYEIASSIADYFNFKLNNRLSVPVIGLDMSDSINLSFYIKLGFHKQLYYKNFRYITKIYQFSGAVSSNIRPYWIYSVEEHKKNVLNRVKMYSNSMSMNSEKLIDKTFCELKKEFNIDDDNSIQLPGILYREVRASNHYGKSSVESYMSNIINLSPLIDPDLVKIQLTINDCDANDLLIAMIFLRYCPDLLKFKFDHGRKIDSESIKMAKLINDKFPLKMRNLPRISVEPIKPVMEDDIENIQKVDISHINYIIKNCVSSKYFERLFNIYFSEEYYIKMIRKMNEDVLFPLQDAHASLAVMLILELIKDSKNHEKNEILDWIDGLASENVNAENNILTLELISYLINFLIGRIDIKNYGNENNFVEVIDISDKNAGLSTPEWLSDSQGRGIVIQSNSCGFNFKIKCHNNGKLKIFLRSKDYRDRNGNRIPIYIEFLDLMIDGEKIFTDKVCSHDKPFIYEREVHDSQIIDFQIKWRPVNNNSSLN